MITPLISPIIAKLTPYTCARDLYKGDRDSVFLDANENAFGSTVPLTVALNRYPDPESKKLKMALGNFLDVPIECIFIGAGSDQIIDLLTRLFIQPGDEVMICEPTFGMYKVATSAAGGRAVSCSLNEDFQIDLDTFQKVKTVKSKMIFCCSPNSPTGNLLRIEDMEKLCKTFTGIVVVDEAYIEFSSQDSLAKSVKDFENLVVLRTMSKAWGLAGIRVGYAIANPQIIQYLNKIKMPYAVNIISEYLAIQALKNKRQLSVLCNKIKCERTTLAQNLLKLGLMVFPSEANFLLVKIPQASMYVQRLAEEFKIVVRDFSKNPGLVDCVRITVGTSEENKKLITALTKLL